MIPTFESQREAWSNPPVDDIGYISSASLLKLRDEELVELIANMERNRYEGWRNYRNQWRELFRLDESGDGIVLDYGCGVGLEALQYARTGHQIVLADIAVDNLVLAERVLNVHGFEALSTGVIGSDNRLFFDRERRISPLDVIHCVGVLHHIPGAVEVVENFYRWLADDGEVRLMLYSDIAFLETKGDFASAMDGVGAYADWYDLERVEQRFGAWFKIERSTYLTKNRHYLGVVLVKR